MQSIDSNNQLTVIPISETIGRWRRWRAESPMGEFDRILNVLHCHVSWFGKHLEISIYGLRKWRWCLPHTVHHRFVNYWTTTLLPWDVCGTIFQQGKRENVRINESSSERYWNWYLSIEICWVTTFTDFITAAYHKLQLFMTLSTCYNSILNFSISITSSTSCIRDFVKLIFTLQNP